MMHNIQKLFVVLALCSVIVNCVEQDCVLPLPRFAFFAPLIYKPNGNLLLTEKSNDYIQNMIIPADDHVVLSCAPYYFKKYSNDKVFRATCKGGQKLVINGTETNWIKDLGCEVRPIEEILKPVVGCPTDAESVEYGYTNPIKEKSLVLGEACYSETMGKTIFIHTKIAGAGNQIGVQLKTENANYLKQAHPTSKYKINLLMQSRLDELNERLTNKLGTTNVPFLEPRHFIDLDSLQNKQFNTILKLGWNFVIKNGYDHLPNWDTLTADVMGLRGKSYDLYMGTHGILSLKNANGENVDIYLNDEEQRFPVPKYLWLVVKSESKAAAFAILNNDKEIDNNTLARDSICESKCDQMPWLANLLKNKAYETVKNGFVWCCDVQSFQKKIKELPAIDGTYGLLI